MSAATSDNGSSVGSATTVFTVATELATAAIAASSTTTSGATSATASDNTVVNVSADVRSIPSSVTAISDISVATCLARDTDMSVDSSPSSATVAAVCSSSPTCWLTRCAAFAVSSPSSAAAQLSVVKSSSGVLSIPIACNTCAFSSGVSTDATTVVNGVTFAGFVMSAGTSEISARSGSALPVLVSVPPLEITLAELPSGTVNASTLKKPESSVTPDGSSASCSLLPLRSTNTVAPAIGASTTRPSKASVTVIVKSWVSVNDPSDTWTVTS